MIKPVNKSLIIALAASLSACGIATDGTEPVEELDLSLDVSALTVKASSTSSAQSYSYVKNRVSPTFSTLEISFNEPLATFDPQTEFSLTYADNTNVAGSWNLTETPQGDTIITFTRDTNVTLPRGTPFTLTLSENVMDLAGNQPQQLSWSFSTAPALSLTVSPQGLSTGSTVTLGFGAGANAGSPSDLPEFTFTGANLPIATVADGILWENQDYSLSIVTQPSGQFCRFINSDPTLHTAQMPAQNATVNLDCSSVMPLSADATQWNDYLQSSLTSGELTAGPVACAGDLSSACKHAGELRTYSFTLAGKTCADINIHDVARTDFNRTNLTSTGSGTLSAEEKLSSTLEWSCNNPAADEFVITSKGLKQNKGLIDLISGSSSLNPNDSNDLIWDFSWIKRKLSITDGADSILHQTGYTRWWSNPIEELQGSLLSQKTEHQIYVITASLSDQALGIRNTRHIGVVALPDMHQHGSEAVRRSTVLVDTANRYLWLELSASGKAGVRGPVSDSNDVRPVLNISKLRYSVVRNTEVRNGQADYSGSNGDWTYVSDGIGIKVFDSHLNRFENITSYDNQGDGIYIESSAGNQFSNISSQGNDRYGMRMTGSGVSASMINTVTNLTTANNGATFELASPAGGGLLIDTNANWNSFTGVQSYSNLNHGIEIKGGKNNLSYSFSSNNSMNGIELAGIDNMLLHTTMGTNQQHGLSITGGTHVMQGLLSTDNYSSALFVGAGYTPPASIDVATYVKSGNTPASTQCSDENGGTDCSTITFAVTGATSPVYAASNQTKYSGVTSLGWKGNGLSSWGNATDYGRCVNETGNDDCAEYDWSISTAAISSYNTHTEVASTLRDSYDGNLTSPTAISIDYSSAGQEISGDFIGNDNGLCETNEVCSTGATNFGVYQGAGL